MDESSNQTNVKVDRKAPQWDGRIDGTEDVHLRWHQQVQSGAEAGLEGSVALLGFASDAGVLRNKGRVGAAEGPSALRKALAPLAIHEQRKLIDLGDIVVTGDELEQGQARLAAAVDAALSGGSLPIILGGGHETAFGTGSGIYHFYDQNPDVRVGILNLDAHFDLRRADRRSSGTPFLNLAENLQNTGRGFHYAVLGISEPNNTKVLFNAADALGAKYLLDEDCSEQGAAEFVADFLEGIDVLYLTIDLDVLPASVAPGVSAPAGLGVPMKIISQVCKQVASSGKLKVADVVELNPKYDVDSRTARSAARLIYALATTKSTPAN
ncbi:formimidoylglutamase [Glutamicibacter sp.]|uniref:formimidoylglutamase n=1 Tax=Glutamicibacter sp. TaxID=1931995 RepID=UPI0028BDCB46|nr:formimidoylglutamase [Glutamicibacter sp.]